MELIQELGAAERLSADPQSAQHPGLIPHPDLPQLDPGPEDTGQVLHQGPEIHPALRREEKDDLGAVKAVLRLDQLHLQLVALDELLAHIQGVLLLFPVVPHLLLIPVCGQADHRAQGLHHRLVGDKAIGPHTHAVFQPFARLHNDALAVGHRQPLGVKIILFAARFEPDADDLCHVRCSSVSFLV